MGLGCMFLGYQKLRVPFWGSPIVSKHEYGILQSILGVPHLQQLLKPTNSKTRIGASLGDV